MKILVVDDDLDLRGLIDFALRSAGYLVVTAGDGAEAVETFRRELPDLVVLDVNLPIFDGFEVCRRIREESAAPVLMLTVRSGEADHVYGLDHGADDYLTKPFSPRTLLAHVRALLRRPGLEQASPLVAGDLSLDPDNQTVTVCGQSAARLTNREFRLLQCLFASVGHTVPADRLTSHVWGFESVGDRQLLKQIVHRVRQKVEADPAEPRYLVTVPGVGYVLRTTPARQEQAAEQPD